MTGLASAVDHIHHLGPAAIGPKQTDPGRSTGYHHDLKLKNILVFFNDILKISDFGTARLKQAVSAGVSHKTAELISDPEYAAPDQTMTKKASRPHDIWGLGCIYLEMMVWAFGLEGEIDDFYNERNPEWKNVEAIPACTVEYTGTASFWYEDEHEREYSKRFKLKTVVLTRMSDLKRQLKCDQALYVVMDQIEQMLSIDPKDRPESGEVRSNFEAMICEAKLDLSKYNESWSARSTGYTNQDPGEDRFDGIYVHAKSPKYGPPSTIGDDTADDNSGFDGEEQGNSNDLSDISPAGMKHLSLPTLSPLDAQRQHYRRYSTGGLGRGMPPVNTPIKKIPLLDISTDLAQTGSHTDDSLLHPGTPRSPIIVTTDHDLDQR